MSATDTKVSDAVRFLVGRSMVEWPLLLALSAGAALGAVVLAVESGSAWRAAESRQGALQDEGLDLAIFEGPAGEWCRLDNVASVLAAGQLDLAGRSTTTSGVLYEEAIATPGGIEALGGPRTSGGDVLVGAALESELGLIRLDAAGADIWDPPPPAEFAGRAIVHVRDRPSSGRCFVRFSPRTPDEVMVGVAAWLEVAAGGPIVARWHLPSAVQDDEPKRDVATRWSRWLALIAGVLSGCLMAVVVTQRSLVDDAHTRLHGVSPVAFSLAIALRWFGWAAAWTSISTLMMLPLLGGEGGAHSIAPTWVYALAAAASGHLVESVRVLAPSPWSVLRYRE